MFILTCMCQINFRFRACIRMITHTHLIKRITCIIVTYMLFHANKHCLNFEWLLAHGYSMSFQQMASTTTSQKWLIFSHFIICNISWRKEKYKLSTPVFCIFHNLLKKLKCWHKQPLNMLDLSLRTRVAGSIYEDVS